MVWSLINTRGAGKFIIVHGTMKPDQYIEVFRSHLPPQIKKWFPENEYSNFMHYSALCHRAKSITKFLRHNNIEVSPWPGFSPDMNPIENLKENAKEMITNHKQLIEKLMNVCHHSHLMK